MAEINEKQKAWAVSREELELRWEYGNTDMTLEEFNKRFEELKKAEKIIRDGRIIK